VRLAITHRTAFAYDVDIADTTMEMRLRPRDDAGQRCNSYSLKVEPQAPVRGYRDALGNYVEVYNVRPPHRLIQIEARSIVETGLPVGDAETISEGERFRLLRFDGPIVDSADLRALSGAAGSGRNGSDGLPALLSDLAGVVWRSFDYEPDVTSVDSTVDDLLRLGRGVCQDFAHLWIALCRARGIPARYVSGYVWNGDDRQEGASHAWGEAWVPNRGWVAHDPTNWTAESGGLVGPQHGRVAVGRDYRDVPPTRGVFHGAAQETLAVSVSVRSVSPVAAG
jgi:transglutaminase-like putative cysteine protease